MLCFLFVLFRYADVCLCLVHPVAVLNATFGMTSSLLMLVEDARCDHMEEAYSRAGLMTALYVCSHECLLLFTPSCCCECFYHL